MPEVTLTGISAEAPEKTTYTVGEELNLDGLKVTASYSDGTSKDVTDSEYVTVDTSACDMNAAGTYTIKVSYTEGEFNGGGYLRGHSKGWRNPLRLPPRSLPRNPPRLPTQEPTEEPTETPTQEPTEETHRDSHSGTDPGACRNSETFRYRNSRNQCDPGKRVPDREAPRAADSPLRRRCQQCNAHCGSTDSGGGMRGSTGCFETEKSKLRSCL